ncbi:MAG: isochorismatase family protein [Luteimonas sp.]|nr:isochorismatase family protein [Luteimonas sp.]
MSGNVGARSEIVIHKKYNSSFASTDLDKKLPALGVTRLILAGAAINWSFGRRPIQP